MKTIKKSFDGGLSENLYFNSDYEKDFIEEKGFDKWVSYRNEWEQYCKLERESDYPPHLELELNYSCNLRCPMCTWAMEKAAEKKEDWFKFEDYKKIIDEAVTLGTKSIRLCYINEPLIRQDIDQFIKYAVDAGIIDVLITTNGTLLTKTMSKKLIDAGLTKINVSLDAITDETYDKIRIGGNLKITVKNIHDFLELRKQMGKKLPKMRLTFVVTKINFHEYDAFVSYWKDKVDSIGIQHLQNPFGEGRFEDNIRSDAIIIKKSPVPEKFHCAEPYKRLTLRSNGDVLPCCSFYAADLVVGNWKKNSLKEIWNNEKMRELRKIHKDGDYTKNNVCKNCIQNYTIISD
ncbi:MAG: radical SAM protein [Candidatus Nitrosotenuis sp.]